MNWELAIEKNHEALRRILAMLVAMVGMTGAGIADKSGGSAGPATLPRHLHRFVLRLLRPAEAATRRLIIIAAQGLVVKLPPFRPRKPGPNKPPLNRKNGYGTGLVIRPGPLPEWAKALVPKRSPNLSLPLLDPLKRFGVRRRYAKPSAMPQIRVLGGDPIVPFFRQPEPLLPPAPTSDDPLDATRMHCRLEAIGRALDDLPKQAQRMARWQARRDARWEREREGNRVTRFSVAPNFDGTVQHPNNASGKRRFHRVSPMRPGRPPGFRKRPTHEVHEVLNELHGLAVWARERRDSS